MASKLISYTGSNEVDQGGEKGCKIGTLNHQQLYFY